MGSIKKTATMFVYVLATAALADADDCELLSMQFGRIPAPLWRAAMEQRCLRQLPERMATASISLLIASNWFGAPAICPCVW